MLPVGPNGVTRYENIFILISVGIIKSVADSIAGVDVFLAPDCIFDNQLSSQGPRGEI